MTFFSTHWTNLLKTCILQHLVKVSAVPLLIVSCRHSPINRQKNTYLKNGPKFTLPFTLSIFNERFVTKICMVWRWLLHCEMNNDGFIPECVKILMVMFVHDNVEIVFERKFPVAELPIE